MPLVLPHSLLFCVVAAVCRAVESGDNLQAVITQYAGVLNHSQCGQVDASCMQMLTRTRNFQYEPPCYENILQVLWRVHGRRRAEEPHDTGSCCRTDVQTLCESDHRNVERCISTAQQGSRCASMLVAECNRKRGGQLNPARQLI
jgi:hypothetical protein